MRLDSRWGGCGEGQERGACQNMEHEGCTGNVGLEMAPPVGVQ